MDISLLSATELASELGGRVRRERLRQNLTQGTLADKAGVSRVTVTRMEAGGAATLTSFLAVVTALGRSGDLQQVLDPAPAETIDAFLTTAEPTRQRGRR